MTRAHGIGESCDVDSKDTPRRASIPRFSHPPSGHLRAIGVDEFSVRNGRRYRLVAADLDQRRPIRLGGCGRTEKGRRALRTLLKANQRLHKAYLLKESFGQLWEYRNPLRARRFFENRKARLRWQRLEPFKKFAAMIERHGDGIVGYCDPDHTVSLGFMEGLINEIRVIQRRAYGITNEEYLMLKVITSYIKEPKSP